MADDSTGTAVSAWQNARQQKVTEKYRQPPFDPRIYSVVFVPSWADPNGGQADYDGHTLFPDKGGSNGGLARGYMIEDVQNTSATGVGRAARYVKFLYNPGAVQIDFTLPTDPNQFASAASYSAATSGFQGSNYATLPGTTSFTLLFDRTYEVSNPQADEELRMRGVRADVEAMMTMLGMNDTTPAIIGTGAGSTQVDPSADSADKDKNKDGTNSDGTDTTDSSSTAKNIALPDTMAYISNVMQFVPVYAVFCATDNPLEFYGWVNSLSIQYTHFSQMMIPTRATLSMSMQMLPQPNRAVASP